VGDELQIINTQLRTIEKPGYQYEDVLHKLTPVISNLLDTDMNGLMNILYRVDVSEKKFRETFATGKPEKIAEMIARLIVDRHLEKAVTRKKYSS